MLQGIKSKLADIGVIRFLSETAEAYALQDQQREPGAEHLLLAALDLPDGAARRAFEQAGASPDGRMYGFHGHFEVMRVVRTERGAAYSALPGSPQNHGPRKLAARALRRWLRWLRGRAYTPRAPYLLWEFRAVKPR